MLATGCFLFCVQALAAPYSSGNLLIYRVGDGSAPLSAAATAVFLDEYTPAGALVQSVAVPTSISGSNLSLVATGNNISEGMISRSVDGACVLFTGYNAAVGTASVSTTNAAATGRVIGVAYANGSIDTSSSMPNFSTGSIRTAASTDCNDLWAAGSNDGVRYVTRGSVGAAATQISGGSTNNRQLNVFGGQLYVTTASGALRLATVGTGTPTTSGQTITNLPGLPTSTGSPYSFFFADLTGSVVGVDTLYVADDTSVTGGLLKYSLVSGSWVANGSIIGPLRGLTATVAGTSVTLYGTSATGSANTLVKVTDGNGYNGALSGSLSLVATAGVNTRFAGVAIVPLAPSCTPGSYSATGNQPCTLAQAGFYVPTSGALSQTACLPGSFQANTGSISCNPAQVGNYVAGSAAIAQTQCAIGSYQPATGQSACTLAQAGFYVPVTGANAQTPCPLGTTSNVGAAACSGLPLLNIDNSVGTTYDAATDGVLLLRYLFGFRGAALISNARGSGPLLRDAAQIELHIATYLTLFDVDGDNQTLSLTDGLMILRRLLNPNPLNVMTAAEQSAITANAKRGALTDTQVLQRIEALKP